MHQRLCDPSMVFLGDCKIQWFWWYGKDDFDFPRQPTVDCCLKHFVHLWICRHLSAQRYRTWLHIIYDSDSFGEYCNVLLPFCNCSVVPKLMSRDVLRYDWQSEEQTQRTICKKLHYKHYCTQIFYAYKNLFQTYNKNKNLSSKNLFYHPNLITPLRAWAGAHVSLCAVRRRLLEAGRKAKNPLKSSFPTQKWRQTLNQDGQKSKYWTVENFQKVLFSVESHLFV